MSRSFDKTLASAADVMAELRSSEAMRKLTPKAFRREALRAAGCKGPRVAEIEELLANSHASDAALAFVRRLAREFGESQYVRPFKDAAQALRIFGNEDTQSQLAALSITASEAIAVAAWRVTKKHPQRFGTITDFDAHTIRIDELRTDLETLYVELKAALGGDDVAFDQTNLSNSERDRGLARIIFRQFPSIAMSPNWPQRLVEAELRRRSEEKKAA